MDFYSAVDSDTKYESSKQEKDIYFQERYGELYEEHEEGEVQTFEYHSDYGTVKNLFIKRKIPVNLSEKDYYDITTPYGFGGPVTFDVKNLEKLLSGYFNSFSEYCRENNIVSEFIRFHLLENNDVMQYYYGETMLVGMNIARNLKKPLWQDCHKSIKRDFKKSEKNNLEVLFDTEGAYLEEFLTVYYATMNRNDATDYYYFDKAFFEKMNENLKGNYVYAYVLLDGKVISASLNLYGKKYAYGFLGGTLSEYYSLTPAAYLEIQSIKWLQEQGLEYYILGGGYEEDDGIYKFKKKFAKTGIYPFHIGKKIHNKEIYDQLVEAHHLKKQCKETSFFPAYRLSDS